jgi:dTMP kinase
MPGLFITFEGPDGAGKTTQLKLLAQRLTAMGYQVLCTREPGGTRISDKIREVLLDPENQEMDARTEALLYAAARAQHVTEVIQPALSAGKVVLCDRFVDSSLAYQGWGRGLDKETIGAISRFATDNHFPTITLLLDVCPTTGTKRVVTRNGDRLDRIEQEENSFRDRVYKGFRELATLHPSRIVCIDASGTIEEVREQIWAHITTRLNEILGGASR